jgi:hypothetical protein
MSAEPIVHIDLRIDPLTDAIWEQIKGDVGEAGSFLVDWNRGASGAALKGHFTPYYENGTKVDVVRYIKGTVRGLRYSIAVWGRA